MGLTLLQHRGQDAAGILTHDQNGFHFVRQLGLVSDVFTPEIVPTLTGEVALGHVRYSTVGKSEISSVQPFLINFPYGLGMAHNGNLVNFHRLTRELKERSHRHPVTGSDTEAILNLFAESLSVSTAGRAHSPDPTFDDVCRAVAQVFERAIGSYSIVTLIAGYGLVAFKDPNGIRPLSFSSKAEEGGRMSHLFSSESSVPSFLGYGPSEEVGAGEVIVARLDGRIERRRLSPLKSRPCMFEWVYFASPQSEIEGSTVYGARIELGRKLAAQIRAEMKAGRIKPDLIVPVPETARIAAIALSEELGIPYREVLIKNRYISRTFILNSQDKREKAVSLKLAPVESEIVGKNVLLVDDSIVRGTTSRKLIEVVRGAGAREVYFVSSAPPIRYPCYYGIDFPRQSELIAHGKAVFEVERELGADRVFYQELPALEAALQPKKSGAAVVSPCLACLNGCYPTSVEDGAELVRGRSHEALPQSSNLQPRSQTESSHVR